MIISLIFTSRGNTKALKRFLESINQQKGIPLKNIELIFADQDDDSVLIDDFSNTLNIKYIKIQPSSLSVARNQVLKYSSGDIICFPDDDCWYHEKFLSKLIEYFKKTPTAPMWLCNIKDPFNNKCYGKRPEKKQFLNNKNIYYLPSSVNIFINLNIVNKSDIFFNEYLGVGAKWGAGEDVELSFRIYKKYSNCYYDGTIHVYHPVVIGGDSKFKAYKYGVGAGALAAYLLTNNNYPHLTTYINHLINSILGCTYYLFHLKYSVAKTYWSRFNGLIYGLFYGYFFFRNKKYK